MTVAHPRTIAALATPEGAGALAVVRMSGPEAWEICRCLLGGQSLPAPRRATVLRLRDPATGGDLGDAILVLFAGPRSYTGEDLAELTTYGGVAAPRAVLNALLGQGARLAEPGEFTRRALLRGRIGLDEAEALLAVAGARTTRGLAAGLRAARGELGRRAGGAREGLLDILAEVEAALEFPEDEPLEWSRAAAARRLDRMAEELRSAVEGALRTDLAVQGIRVVILGPPNVGKSSIFNRLLGSDRAIISPGPGTTRDTLEAELSLEGHRVSLVDTAGVRPAREVVEAEGVRRSLREGEGAGIGLVVAETGEGGIENAEALASSLAGRRILRILNKIDQHPGEAPEGWIPVSALTGAGFPGFLAALVRAVEELVGFHGSEDLALNLRQREALLCCADALEEAVRLLEAGSGDELVALGVREAVDALGELTGDVANEDMLDRIFSRFCIGK